MKTDGNTIIIQNLRLLSITLILVLGFIVQDALGQTNEADLVVVVGDIDNLGYGFPAGFDVFSGKSTPVHGYPFKPEADDPPGTDRIMLGTGFKNPQDGYSRTSSRPDNLPQSIDIQYNLGSIQVKSAAIQIFADDFQSSLWKSKFQVTLNGQSAPFLEDVFNSLLQTGPIGKLITVQIPEEFLPQVASGRLTIYIDDPTTGAGDGYAIDFVRLLVNPRFSQVGKVSGKVTDAKTGLPISGVMVSAAGMITGQTGSDGAYVLNGVPAGLAVVTASKSGYTSINHTTDLVEGGSAILDFSLSPAPSVEQTPTPTVTVSPTPARTSSTPLATSPPSTSIPVKEAKFRAGPSVTLRPVTDVIEANQDGIIELFMNNPSLNDVTLNVDARVSVPSGMHVYGENFGQGAGAGVVSGTFSVPPGTSRTISIVIKADKSARIGSHIISFSGLYYPDGNKDYFQPISLTYSVNVKAPSKNPESAEASNPQDVKGTKPTAGKEIPLTWIILAIVVLGGIAIIFGLGRRPPKTEINMEA